MKLSKEVMELQLEYADKVRTAIDQGLTALEFKKYSGGMGVYPQKEEGDFMVRARIYSGLLTLEQLKGMNILAKEYSSGSLHLTTRQSIQFHKVKLQDTVKVVEGLLTLGIITLGAGGNGIRNISCPPLSGVDRNEVFDVTHHAKVATSFALNLPGMNRLPRKYKIAFSNNDEDVAKATLSDLGFVAKLQNGERGFKVYGAGGLGNQSSLAIILKEFIREEDILYHILAMKNLFEEHGDRTNRNKARIRFIVKRLGQKKFKRLYESYLEQAKQQQSLKYIPNTDDTSLIAEECNVVKVDQEQSVADGVDIIAQKNLGRYSLYIHPTGGDISSDTIDDILLFLEGRDKKADFRLSNTQGIYIRDLTVVEVKGLYELTKDDKAGTRFGRSLTCTGAKNCKIGLLDSQRILSEITTKLSAYSKVDLKRLPEIRVSGCRNSCALHQTVSLGFEGSKIKTSKGTKPAYKVFMNGKVGERVSKISEGVGIIAEEFIVDFLKEIITYLIEQNKKFEEVLDQEPYLVKELILHFEERSVG